MRAKASNIIKSKCYILNVKCHGKRYIDNFMKIQRFNKICVGTELVLKLKLVQTRHRLRHWYKTMPYILLTLNCTFSNTAINKYIFIHIVKPIDNSIFTLVLSFTFSVCMLCLQIHLFLCVDYDSTFQSA